MYFLYQPSSVPRKILDLYWKKNLNPVIDIQISIKYVNYIQYTRSKILKLGALFIDKVYDSIYSLLTLYALNIGVLFRHISMIQYTHPE